MAIIENPQVTVLDVLPNQPNKFRRLLEEGLIGEALDDAIYTLCIMDVETWNDFSPKKLPLIPHGFREAHEAYRKTSKSERSEAWKALLEKFPGYFKALEQVESFNKSRQKFLKEMLAFFESKGLTDYADKVQRKIYEYGR